MNRILLTFSVAIMLVTGQILWKIGIEHAHYSLTPKFIFSRHIIKFVFSPLVLGGLTIYGGATLLYFEALAKYDYYTVQAIILPTSLILALFAQYFFFKGTFPIASWFGTLFILIGVGLVLHR